MSLSVHTQKSPLIGRLNEGELHAALKDYCAEPGDQFEVPVGKYVVDILRGNKILEIQTQNFSAISGKMRELLVNHPLRLIYPIPSTKWIVKKTAQGAKRRKSPKKRCAQNIFEELVSFPSLLKDNNFEIEVLLIEEEEHREPSRRQGRRRGGWVVAGRRLLAVEDRVTFCCPGDLIKLVNRSLPAKFDTRELAIAMGQNRALAQKAAYCLRHCGVIHQVDKRGNSLVYELC